jgi:hypothetical protein
MTGQDQAGRPLTPPEVTREQVTAEFERKLREQLAEKYAGRVFSAAVPLAGAMLRQLSNDGAFRELVARVDRTEGVDDVFGLIAKDAVALVRDIAREAGLQVDPPEGLGTFAIDVEIGR